MAVEPHPPSSQNAHSQTPRPIISRPVSSHTEAHHMPDVTSARARRSIAASRAARNGISSMMEALRTSKPPRAPTKPYDQLSSSTVNRRHALIPLAEGREQLEARIRILEHSLVLRDEISVRLKRQLGRALVKRRHFERERETLLFRLSNAVTSARSYYTLAVSLNSDFRMIVDNLTASFRVAFNIDNENDPNSESLFQTIKNRIANANVVENISDCVNTIACAVQTATQKINRPIPAWTIDSPVPSLSTLPPTTAGSANISVSRPASTAPSDDDTKSCASFSSSAFGEDRDAQIESLVELIDILDAKLSSGVSHPAASNTVARARQNMLELCSKAGSDRPEGTENNFFSSQDNRDEPLTNDARRDLIVHAVKEILSEIPRSSGEGCTLSIDEVLALTELTKLELENAQKEIKDLRKLISNLEKCAERGLRYDDAVERNVLLERELATAKKTIARMIQSTQTPRRPSHGVCVGNAPQSAGSTSEVTCRGGHADPEAMKRILRWRQTASCEATDSNSITCSKDAQKYVLHDGEVEFDEAEQAPVLTTVSRNTMPFFCRETVGIFETQPTSDVSNPLTSPPNVSRIEKVETNNVLEEEIPVNRCDDGRSKDDNLGANTSILGGSDATEVDSVSSALGLGYLRLGTGRAVEMGDELVRPHNVLRDPQQIDGLRGLLG